MKKKIIIITALAILLVCSCIAFVACSDNNHDGTPGLKFELIENKTAYEVSAGRAKNAKDIVIPSTYKGLPVTSIREWAFEDYPLVSIIIPDSVKNIGESAFLNCYKLSSVTIGNGVINIGNYAFSYCYSLSRIEISSSVKSIGYFYNCTSLIEITVDSGNENYSSENGVLFDKDKTTLIFYPANRPENEYTIPNSVTKIEAYAFLDFSSLEHLTIRHLIIPSSVTEIGKNAFRQRLWWSSEVSETLSITWYYNPELSVSEFSDFLKTAVIPEGTISIGDRAFSNCRGLESIIIPNSVTTIGDSAFYNCYSLNSITLPDNLAIIGYNAFSGCSFETIIIPNSVTTIGDSAFYNCYSLNSITLPDNLAIIGYNAFSGCYSLKSINIPNSVINIGFEAFIGTGIIYNAPNNSIIYVDNWIIGFKGNIGANPVLRPDTVGIAGRAFFDCYSISAITIPNSVKYIGNSAFSSCTALLSVSISNSITNIEANTFYGCLALNSVILPSSIINIGYQAFYNCKSLESITIPNSVLNIEGYAFYQCNSLSTIYIERSSEQGITSLENAHFSNNLKNIYVPDAQSAAAYKSAENWSRYADIINVKP